jgi:hypothetical protein
MNGALKIIDDLMDVRQSNDLDEKIQEMGLPSTPVRVGQIRWSGSGSKFIFQFHGKIEFSFLGTQKLKEIVKDTALHRDALKSWHSEARYTPVLFYPKWTDYKTLIVLFFLKEGTFRSRGYWIHHPDFNWSDVYKIMPTMGLNASTIIDDLDDDIDEKDS